MLQRSCEYTFEELGQFCHFTILISLHKMSHCANWLSLYVKVDMFYDNSNLDCLKFILDIDRRMEPSRPTQ